MKVSHKAKISSKSVGFEWKKKLVFNLILLVFPIILFLLFESGLRVFNYGNNLNLFLKSKNYPGYFEINPNVNYRYFNKLERTSSTNDIFLIEKPDTCFRIFVFGESTTRGYPYQAGTSFPKILYYRLQDAIPGKRIEVINLSASAINSYSYVDMLGEVLDNKPDLLLVYGGHNEYYGALGIGSVESGGNTRWIKKLRLSFCKLRSFQLVQNFISKSSTILSKNNLSNATLMERIASDKEILYNSPKFQDGVEQFQNNISELIKRAKRKNVPVVLSELVNNIKDLPPFKSSFVEGFSPAIDVYNEAKRLEEIGKIKEAKELYYKAKDLDVIRFRSPEILNEVIDKLCQQYNLPLVPMKSYFEMKSPNQLIGDNLILEHLHPNIDGYFLMADAFFNTLKEKNLIGGWEHSKIKPSEFYRKNWGFTELDSMIGDLNIKSLKAGWPFKPENVPNRFVETYKYSGTVDSIAFAYLISDTKHFEEAHINLAAHYAKKGLYDMAFKEYYSLIKLHPYIADLYYDASKYLIAQNKFSEALRLINSAPLMEKNYLYYYMTGTLKLKIGDLKNAIKNLEYAYKLLMPKTEPTSVLLPLNIAYREIGDKENEKRISGIIKQYIPDFGKEAVKDIKEQGINNLSLDETINLAENLLKKNDFNRAKDLLLLANKEEETARANKLIGMIYTVQKNHKLAYQYSMKAYQLDPTDYDNNNNLYILCLLNNDLNNAKKILEELRILNIDPNKLQRLENLYFKKQNEINSK